MKIKKIGTAQIPKIEGAVVDSFDSGSDETTNAPSIRAVKEKILDVYSTNEIKTNEIWIDGKPIYRKVITGTKTSIGVSNVMSLVDLNYDTIIQLRLLSKNSDPIAQQYYSNEQDNLRCWIQPDKGLRIQSGSLYPSVPFIYIVILEYTKTTD